MTLPPYLRRNKNKIGESGRESEKRLARKLKAKQKPASGAFEGHKGDLELSSILMECKSTVRDSLQLKFGYLAKIAHEAANIGKMPAVTISFTLPDGSPFRNGDWVLIRMKDFEERFK